MTARRKSAARQEVTIALASFLDGRPREDAPADLMFLVTQDDVANGVPGDPFHCPLTCAIERALPGSLAAFFLSSVLIDVDGHVYRWMLPEATARAVALVDARKVPPVGMYRLKAPRASNTLAAKHGYREAALAEGRTPRKRPVQPRAPRVMMRGSEDYLRTHGLAEKEAS
jgi:hypothetical protein